MTTVTQTRYPVDTAAACRVAGIEPQRFNELVSAEMYLAAPSTIRGRKRMFEEEDVIALFLYAHFRERGITTATAGKWASIVQAATRAAAAVGADDRTISFQVGIDGSIAVGMAEPSAPTFFGITVALANVRAIVAQKLDEWAVVP